MIIILAAIVIFTGLNTPDRAQFAKFAQEFSGFQEAVTNAFLNEKMKLSTSGQYRTDAQIYYKIATGTDTQGTPTSSGTVSALEFTTIPEAIQGNNYYKITRTEVEGLKPQEMFSTAGGNLYITDKGEVFVQPGYLVEENGTSRCYVNASKYYMGEGVEVSGGGDTPAVNQEDLQSLYAYFVTSGRELDWDNLTFENNDYLEDATSIQSLGYSSRYIANANYIEPAYFFIFYQDNYYKITYYVDPDRNNKQYFANVEAIAYDASNMSDIEKLRAYYIDLQRPWSFEDTLADVSPITEASSTVTLYDYETEIETYEFISYQGNFYKITQSCVASVDYDLYDSVTLISWNPSWSDLEKMRYFFVELQGPEHWDDNFANDVLLGDSNEIIGEGYIGDGYRFTYNGRQYTTIIGPAGDSNLQHTNVFYYENDVLEEYFITSGRTWTTTYPNEAPILDASTSIINVDIEEGELSNYTTLKYHGRFYRTRYDKDTNQYDAVYEVLLNIVAGDEYICTYLEDTGKRIFLDITADNSPTMILGDSTEEIDLIPYISWLSQDACYVIDISSFIPANCPPEGIDATIHITVDGEEYSANLKIGVMAEE